MIDLKQFFSETIQQVIEGAKDAGLYLKDGLDYDKDGYVQVGDEHMNKIEFNNSGTTCESSKSEGKAGLMIKVVDFGIKGIDNNESTSMNKFRFSVPVAFAEMANKKFK